jgi:hypothetical protein
VQNCIVVFIVDIFDASAVHDKTPRYDAIIIQQQQQEEPGQGWGVRYRRQEPRSGRMDLDGSLARSLD